MGGLEPAVLGEAVIRAVADDHVVADAHVEDVAGGGELRIDEQMRGTSCCVLLVGRNAANRKWVNYEIGQAWNQTKGVVAIYIHALKDLDGQQSSKGNNPLDFATFPNGRKLSSVAKAYDPPHGDSKDVYGYIKKNLAAWIEEAIRIRNNNG